MSANIYWRRVNGGKELPVNAPSSFLGNLRDAFGDHMPILLRERDLDILKGMSITDKYEMESYEAIIDAITTHKEIEIYAEY